MRSTSPPHPILVEPLATSMGDHIKVAPGSPLLAVIDPKEPTQGKTAHEKTRQVPTQIAVPDEVMLEKTA
jgi:hypothetical protein